MRDMESGITEKSADAPEGSGPAELTNDDYTVGWICALAKEQTAATVMLEQRHPDLPNPPNDPNAYTLGSIGKHNIAIACLSDGDIGTISAATVAIRMIATFPSIKFGLMVGIGGGVPPKVQLGDIVVSAPGAQHPGVIQWDKGKAEAKGGFRRTSALNKPPALLRRALTKLQTAHEMEGSEIPNYMKAMSAKYPRLAKKYAWSERLTDDVASEPHDAGDVRVHYGLIASGNQVIKDAQFRDALDQSLGGHVLCVEMEAAGLMDDFPCLVIRGICDYADASKNKDWQEYTAMLAAAFARELLGYVKLADVHREESVKDKLTQLQSDTSATRSDVKQVKAALLKGEDVKKLDWLTQTDYGPVQSDFLAVRQPGTGQWLLNSEEFHTWVVARGKTLFCPGIPGAGKTIITSIVVEHLESLVNDDASIGLGYIYCNFQRQEEQTVPNLLVSLLKQLGARRSALPACIQELYNLHNDRRTRPSVEEITKCLCSVVSLYERVVIVVDALDECQSSGGCRDGLLSALSDLQKSHGISIFATSRFIPAIVDRFYDNLLVEIKAVDDDVSKYLHSNLQLLPVVVKKSPGLQKKILESILQAADGMFLLAPIYLNSLNDCLTLNEVRQAVALFPKQDQANDEDGKVRVLASAYDRALQRIHAQSTRMRALAMDVLRWITFAKRQLVMPELQHAVATKSGMTQLDDGDLPDIGDIVAACAGLAVANESSTVVSLAHYTTQEYLLRTRETWLPAAESILTKTCLTYASLTILAEYNPADETYLRYLRGYPFYEYAVCNWGKHAMEAEEGAKDDIVGFLKNDTLAGAAGHALLISDVTHNPTKFGMAVPRGLTGLHLAAYFGLCATISVLHDTGDFPVECSDACMRTPLWYAVRNGHERAVALLLAAAAADANVTSQPPWGLYIDWKSALCMAVHHGNAGIVEQLLAAGAAAACGRNDPYDSFRTVLKDLSSLKLNHPHWTSDPLRVAAELGQTRMLRALLAHGADADGPGGMVALREAADRGHEEAVEVLLAARKTMHFRAADVLRQTARRVAAEAEAKSEATI